ncbi:MAG: hypothetical protein ABEJ88_00960 [Halobacterium sp.]
MTRSPHSNGRQALVAVALTAMLLSAGCTGVLNSGGGGSGSAGGAKLASVPDSAEFVAFADVDGMVEDDTLRGLMNTVLETRAQSEYYRGPTSVSEMLSQAENQTGLSPSKFEDVTMYGQSADSPSSSSSAAMVVTTGFTTDELVSSMKEQGTELSEQTYKDTTLYTYGFEGQSALAPLGDGTFLLGDTDAVKRGLDVEAGDANALGGKLKSVFENTEKGYVRFAASVPQNQIPTDQLNSQSQLNVSAFNSVQYSSGSFSTSGSDVSVTLNLVADSESNGERMYELIDGALSLYSGIGSEEVSQLLEKISVERSGDTVTVSFTDSASNLKDYVRKLYGTAASGSASMSTSASGSGGSQASA